MACRTKTGPHSTTTGPAPWVGSMACRTKTGPKTATFYFFAKTKSSKSFYGEFLQIFFFAGFGCKMKFGESFVFPDPGSRVSHEPLKMISPSCRATPWYSSRFVKKVTRGKNQSGSEKWLQKGRDMLKQYLSNKGRGPLALVLRQRAVARSWARFRVRGIKRQQLQESHITQCWP